MTILIADNTGLLDGSLITEVVAAGGLVRASQGFHYGPGRGLCWHVETRNQMGEPFRRTERTYPDAPGMNALVALRRYLVERERDSIGVCDSCGQMMYRDDDYLMQPVTIAGESNAATWQMHRRCAEGED